MDADEDIALAKTLVAEIARSKPCQYAAHIPDGRLSGVPNPHVHLLVSDRAPDGIPRPAERFFCRANSKDPSRGGCRKDSGGKTRLELRDQALAQKKTIATIENQALADAGHPERIDHRPCRERGLPPSTESHMGPAPIKRMTILEKAGVLERRKQRKGIPSD